MCTSNVTSRGVSYMCNRCSGWVHSKCSGLQNAAEYRRIKNWACISCSSPPTPQIPKTLPSPITTKAPDGDPFTILQFNVNGIGNKQVELGDFLERHKVKVAVIQESIRVQEWSLILVGSYFGGKSIRNYIVKIVIVLFIFLLMFRRSILKILKSPHICEVCLIFFMFVTNEENWVANNSNSSRKSLGFLYILQRTCLVDGCLLFEISTHKYSHPDVCY